MLSRQPVNRKISWLSTLASEAQLADAGRQQADNSQIREVVRRNAGAADISDPVRNEWLFSFAARVGWRQIAETVALESIAQLHEDGLKANEQDVKAAAGAEIDSIKIAPETRELVERARKNREGALDWSSGCPEVIRIGPCDPPGASG